MDLNPLYNIWTRLFRLGVMMSLVPTFLFNFFMTFVTSRRWYNRIDERVVLGGLPYGNYFKKLLKEEHIKLVICMAEDYEIRFTNGKKEWQSAGVESIQLPSLDIFQAPPTEMLLQGVNCIDSFVSGCKKSSKDSVYVHCKAGRTRSAVLVTCYLMKKYNWTPQEASDHLKTKRSNIWFFPIQWNALHSFYETIHQKS